MSDQPRPEKQRKRYVTWHERAQQEVARQAMFEVALEATLAPEAMPPPGKWPFLAYHGECGRMACDLAAHDELPAAARDQVVFEARWAVRLGRR